MLELKDVDNIQISKIFDAKFDIAIFACGYEGRCTYLAKKLNFENIKKVIVFGFKEHQDNHVRSANENFYNTIAGERIIVSSQEEKEIYCALIAALCGFEDQSTLNILIDYTSMSRLWYSGILNFLRLQSEYTVSVYLNYSLGIYQDEFLDYSYTSINSLPSHEGTLSSNNKTLLVMAIGFSPYLVKSVIEEIEPNEIVGILPIPNSKPEYELKSELIRNDILTKDIDDWRCCSITDLEGIFRTYAELASNNLNQKDLLFISLGPKIFTLASILVSQRFEQVTCLYLKTKSQRTESVEASGEFICNKITYEWLT